MISVIIPIYNVAPYLDICISSVISQSYNDFELILVDDGSTDGSSEKCDDWGKKDDRIVIVHQRNAGVSVARNNGIKKAKGEYIVFVDSDDWVTCDYLLSMINAPSADLVISGINRKYEHHSELDKIYQPKKADSLILGILAVDIFVDLNRKFLVFGPTAKLYKTSVIKDNHIRFPLNCSLGEDLEFNYEYLHHIRTISCVEQANYYYRIIEGGTLSSTLRIDQFDTEYRQWLIQKQFYIEKDMWNNSAKELLFRRLWEIVYGALFRGTKFNEFGWTYIKNVLNIPEIPNLKPYAFLFPCSKWIKIAIIHRLVIVFYGYYILHR